MASPEKTREVIVDELTTLLDEEGLVYPEVADGDEFIDMGLDSLAFAVLITRLEDALGFDPFPAIEQGIPRTVGDFVALCVDSGPTG